MGLTSPRNTLSYQLSRPLCVRRDMSSIPSIQVAKSMTSLSHSLRATIKSPESEAVRFYLLQHAMAETRRTFTEDEVLGEALEIAEQYAVQINELAVRMFYYLLLICVRETRHAKDSEKWWARISAKFGNPVAQFHRALKSHGSSSAPGFFLNSPPAGTIGQLTSSMEFSFNRGVYGPAYGGKKWGAVAKVLNDFVEGTLSPEMMLDTAFTLCHNNGPIFNKGMVFSGYSKKIYAILDVQASGQIPQLISESSSYGFVGFVDEAAVKVHALGCKLYPEAFGGHLDWVTVEAHGKKLWPGFKHTQESLHGTLPVSAKEVQSNKNFYDLGHAAIGGKLEKVTRG